MIFSDNPPIYQLPDELLLHVASYLFDPFTYTDLKNLSLVSHKFHPAAQETIYRTLLLDLFSRIAVPRLLRTLFDRPDLAAKVKTVRIGPTRQSTVKICEAQGFPLEFVRARSLMKLGELGYTESHPWSRTIQNSLHSGFAGVLLTLLPALGDLSILVADTIGNPSSDECVSGLFGSMVLPDLIVKRWDNLQNFSTNDMHVFKCNAPFKCLTSLNLKAVSIDTIKSLNGPGSLQGTDTLQYLILGVPMAFMDPVTMGPLESHLSCLFEALNCNRLRSLCIDLSVCTPNAH